MSRLKRPTQMVTHCAIDTDTLQCRIFTGGFNTRDVDPHAAAVGDGRHGFEVEAVVLMAVDIMNEAVINTQCLEPQIPQVAEGHPAYTRSGRQSPAP